MKKAIALAGLASVLALVGSLQLWASAGVSLSDTDPGPKTYTTSFAQSNPSGQANLVCNASAPCDDTTLTVTLQASYVTAHPNAAVTVKVSWTDADPTGGSAPRSDYDMYVYPGTSTSANWQSASGANPEQTAITPLSSGTKTYKIRVVPYTSKGETVTVRVELVDGSNNFTPGPCDARVFGAADPVCPGAPRYQNFYAPKGTSAQEGTQGEYNIGYNPKSGRILNMNIGPIWRITPPEWKTGGGPKIDSGLPESCPEVWEDVSNPSTDVGLDPILWTDEKTGRTFATNSTVGGAQIYTDNDGGDPPANDQPNSDWIQGFQPPNGGADHETITSGPLPPSLAALGNPTNQGQWVLYCSQDLVAPSMCQRSLTLGTSFENPFPGTGFNCAGLHGHAKIAPDGTGWLPVKSCGNGQGGSITTDSSTSPWTEFTVKGNNDLDGNKPFTAISQAQGADPSIAFDSASTAYYCYVNSEAGGLEGHVHVAVGQRQPGTTTIKWIRDFDVGKSHGVVNAAHTEAWGGSTGRAACGFIGSNQPGNYQSGVNHAGGAPQYPGDWYAFIATTYDEGKHWITVNATPNDPVQHHTGVWQQGGSGEGGDRNLLDFNEASADENGRFLYGYSDGCVSTNCIAGAAANDGTAYMRVARQIGGKTLNLAYDTKTDTNDGIGDGGLIAPKVVQPRRACLLDKSKGHPAAISSTRDDTGSHLKWKEPDAGGSSIVNYDIYRGTTPGGPYDLLASTADNKTAYDDATADPAVTNYYYRIKANSAATLTSEFSNELRLGLGAGGAGENLCLKPGLTLLTDSDGVGGTAPTGSAGPGMDLLSFQMSQPFQSDGVNRLRFTINTDPGVSPQPAGSSWYVAMKIVNGATTRYKGVHMTWNGANPTFESYTPGASNAGTTDGRFVTAGTQVTADPSSNYVTPFDKVIIVVKASDLGLTAGDVITAFVAGVTASTGGVITGTVDEMPDGLAYDDSTAYAVVSNQFCRPNTEPTVDTFTASPLAGNSPLTVTFDGTASDSDQLPAPADTIATYHLDFGDGNKVDLTSQPAGVQHTYTITTAHESFRAVLTVTDSRGKDSVNGKFVQIEVDNPVIARLTPSPTTVDKGDVVTLDASASSASAGNTIVEYTFNPGDGSGNVVQAGSSYGYTYLLGGASTGGMGYTAGVSVKDSAGLTSATPGTALVTVINNPPVADATPTPATGTAPLLVDFDASASHDPDAAKTTDHVMQYDFDFGDGTTPVTSTVPAVSHTFDRPGIYNVLLSVSDEEGMPSAAAQLIQINIPDNVPVAQLAATPPSAAKNTPATLDASGSTDVEPGPLTYRYDFGDGSIPFTTNANTIQHTYTNPGVYNPTVTVFDLEGAASVATTTITIVNQLPVAVLTTNTDTARPYDVISFSGYTSSDPDAGDVVRMYTFDFGDGSPRMSQRAPIAYHAYQAPAKYVATLWVADADGAVSDPSTATVTVTSGDDTQLFVGGAFSPWMLLLIGLVRVARRVRPTL